MDLYTSLSRLCSAPGPSGHIGAVADVAEELLRPLVDEVRRDKLNNLLGLRRCGAPGAKLVLLDAHLDEIGFVVTGHEEGFLRFSTIGGVDPRMLPGRQMEVRLYEPDRPLVPASFGILEPPADAPLLARPDIDLALVPAVCYDRRGFRLGFGGGYYDRWLSGFSGFTVGLCRDCVLQDRVPTEDHDCRVDLLLTETRRFLR